jgi:hypothetical protein
MQRLPRLDAMSFDSTFRRHCTRIVGKVVRELRHTIDRPEAVDRKDV